jgi:hypothetical protein
MDTTNAHKHVTVDATLLDWMAVHGNLCLALRHPQNQGESRALLVSMIHKLGRLLVDEGILTAEEMNRAARTRPAPYGLESV